MDLLVQIIHRISVRAERKVEKEILNDLRRVSNKYGILFNMAQKAVDNPEGIIRDVIFPVVSEQTLKDLIKEFKHTGPAYREKIHMKHPTYQALGELGKAVKTVFLCNYLNSEELRREINEGLNVVENWNSANSFIFYGKGGEIATNRMEDQEMAGLSLHLLQKCLVYVNTLMLQNILSDKRWFDMMMPEDLRALTPLVYTHVNPYGTFRLNMSERLSLEGELA